METKTHDVGKTYEVTTEFVVADGEAVCCKRGKGHIAYQQGQTVAKGERAMFTDAQYKLYKAHVKGKDTPKGT